MEAPRLFEDVKIVWDRDGKKETYTIPSDKVMRAIALIEEHITLRDLSEGLARTQSLSLVKLSRAYGSILRFCGSNITDEEVYVSMFARKAVPSESTLVIAIHGLLGMMVPPSEVKKAMEEAQKQKSDDSVAASVQPGERKPQNRDSSRRRSKSQSVSGESSLVSSGHSTR